jgi:hypothetical protein
MPIRHEVKPGECLSSIAFSHRFAPETIWDHPDNADLRGRRPDPNVLMPGDVVVIPDRERGGVTRATGDAHPFKLKGVPAFLRLRLLFAGAPRAKEPYRLVVEGGREFEGETDDEGRIEHPIPPDARFARLFLQGDEEHYLLDLGHLDPVTSVTGLQARLRALGYYNREVNGDRDDATEASLRRFERDAGLAGDAGLAELRRRYGR